ncbi:MAG: tetratricopeptide repeat protein [Candidatus Aminicenantes bacterium]|nr:tetratricopeptide repeat protein [Candidatus Aminicenantes bacterium]
MDQTKKKLISFGRKNYFHFFLFFFLAISFWFFSACSPNKPKTVPDREKDPQYHYEKAVVALRYDLPDMAIDYLKQALTLDPNHYPSYNLLGVIYHKKGNYQAAADALNRAIELKPDSGEAHHNLGVVYQDMGLRSKAEQEYLKAIKLGYHRSYFLLARLLLDQKKYEESIHFALKAAELNPHDAAIFNLLGVACNERQDYKQAINFLQRAMNLNPEDPIIWINLGIAYLNNGEKEKAKELLEKALTQLKDQTLIDKVKSWLDQIKF